MLNNVILTSDAFPKYITDKKPIKHQSIVHNLILQYNIQLSLSDIFFKAIDPLLHLTELINLHKEWFTVFYGPRYFADLFEKDKNDLIALGAFFLYKEKEYLVILGLM